jgi:hypothetical protein
MLSTIEKAITERIITTALNKGFLVGVCADGEADISPTDNLAEILNSAFSYDCVDLVLEGNETVSFIALNYFNDGIEIITDYSISLEKFISGISFKSLVIDL